MICVIGLGEAIGDLSLDAAQRLRSGGSLTLRTRNCPAARWLAENGVAFDTLDDFYENSSDFDDLTRNTAKFLLRKAREGDMMYAVPGGGGLEDATVAAFLAAARGSGIPCQLIPGVSPRERLAFAAGGFAHARALPAQDVAGTVAAQENGDGDAPRMSAEPGGTEEAEGGAGAGTQSDANGAGAADAGTAGSPPGVGEAQGMPDITGIGFRDADLSDADPVALDRREPLLILELDNPYLAAEVKLRLQDVYPDEHRVCLRDQRGAVRWIPLFELDRQDAGAYGHLAGVAVPALPLSRARRYSFADLVTIMQILRAPGGCPWDREQTHASIAMAAVEEAYEVLEAIQSGDPMRIADELGDLLLQAVFQAQIGAEHGDFDIGDVTTAICHKMISRHRHIFGEASADTPEDVLAIWDAVKRTEKGHETQSDVLLDVPRCFPALLRAQKLQKKAWRDPDVWPVPILFPATPFESVGLDFFNLVRNARLQGVSPEEALSWANDAFIHRYRIAEQHFAAGESFYEASAAAVGEIWRKGG